MSQKTAKRIRQLEARMQGAEIAITGLGAKLGSTDDAWDAAEAVVHNQAVIDAAAARRRARQAERAASDWRVLAYTTLVMALIIAAIAILAVRAAGADIAAEPPLSASADAPTVWAITAPEEPENELIEAALLAKAHVIEECTVTHYDCCVKCCGKTDGITASGVQATPGVTVAVDPDVIPLGADVLVDYGGEIHYYRADDTGAGVKGNIIDLCVASHDEAVQLGRRIATVYWVAPEEVT